MPPLFVYWLAHHVDRQGCRSALVQGRRLLPAPREVVRRQQRRRHRRLRRAHVPKLDYLESLGVDCLWLQPMYPSPFRDDGYDISDYTSIHPSYGTLQDFQTFLSRGARARPARHHRARPEPHVGSAPLVSEARSSRDNPRRDWYVWSDTDDRYRGVRIIFVDTELSNWAWDPVSKAYYWHRFFSHQPDLNYDNPAVREEIWKVMKFWLDLGVDGFRVDAVPYLVEREGTSCENLPETHAVLKELRGRAGRALHRQGAAGRGQHVARGRPAVLRRRATSSTCRFTSRSCPGCSWRSGSKIASRSSTSSSGRRASPTPASGASSCATTTS